VRKITLLLAVAVTGYGQTVDFIRQVRNKPFVDIREYGGVCDGTPQTSALAAAITAGALRVYIPKGCLVRLASNTVPAKLEISGESWSVDASNQFIAGETSGIEVADPTTQNLLLGGLSRIHNIAIKDKYCRDSMGAPGVTKFCPVQWMYNPFVAGTKKANEETFQSIFAQFGTVGQVLKSIGADNAVWGDPIIRLSGGNVIIDPASGSAHELQMGSVNTTTRFYGPVKLNNIFSVGSAGVETPGTSGQVLTSQGSGSPPAWVTPTSSLTITGSTNYANVLKAGVGGAAQWKVPSVYESKDFNWLQSGITLNMGAAGTYTLTLPVCPLGAYSNNTFANDRPQYVGILRSGFTSWGEINGGTCNHSLALAGTGGTLQVYISNVSAYSGSDWTVTSATAGVGEAYYYALDIAATDPTFGTVPKQVHIKLPPGHLSFWAPLHLPLRQDPFSGEAALITLEGSGEDSSIIYARHGSLQAPIYTNKGSCTAVAAAWDNDPAKLACEYQAMIVVTKTGAFAAGPGPQLRNFSMDFLAQYTGSDRSQLVKVNGIYIRGIARSKIDNIGIYRFWDGIDLRALPAGAGNPGGTHITDLRTSTYNTGIWLDGAVDSVRISKHHNWPFRLSATPAAFHANPYYSMRNYGILVGRADNLQINDSLYHSGNGVRFIDLRDRIVSDPFSLSWAASTAILTNVNMDNGASLINGGAILQVNGGQLSQLWGGAHGLRCEGNPAGAGYQAGSAGGAGCWSAEFLYRIASIDAYNGSDQITINTTVTHYLETGDIVSVYNPPGNAQIAQGTWEVIRLTSTSLKLKNSEGRTSFAGTGAGGWITWRRSALTQFGGWTQVTGTGFTQGVYPQVYSLVLDTGVYNPAPMVRFEPTIANRRTQLGISGAYFASETPDQYMVQGRMSVGHYEYGSPSHTFNSNASLNITGSTFAKLPYSLYTVPLVDIEHDTTTGGAVYQISTNISGNTLTIPAEGSCGALNCFFLNLSNAGQTGITHKIQDNLLNGYKTFWNGTGTVNERNAAWNIAFQDTNGYNHEPTFTHAQLMDGSSLPISGTARYGKPVWCMDCEPDAGNKKCVSGGDGALAVLMHDGTGGNYFYCIDPRL
jgi:hypothetical protein